jgi:hypothetical protein
MLVQQKTEMDGFEPKKNLALLSFLFAKPQ